jgi:hypothetical protein
MKMTPVTSSNIAAIGYDLICTELVVQFKNGKTFYYLEVSQEEHAALMAAESVGKHFNQFIKSVKVGREVVIAITADINTDDELVAEVDAAYEKISNGTAVFTSNADVNKMMAEKIELLREALQKIASVDAEFNVLSEVWVIADEALEATKGGE